MIILTDFLFNEKRSHPELGKNVLSKVSPPEYFANKKKAK